MVKAWLGAMCGALINIEIKVGVGALAGPLAAPLADRGLGTHEFSLRTREVLDREEFGHVLW